MTETSSIQDGHGDDYDYEAEEELNSIEEVSASEEPIEDALSKAAPAASDKKLLVDKWFSISGQKITEDDPTVTLLLFVRDLIADAPAKEKMIWEQFLIDFDKRKHELTKTVGSLDQHRETLLIEIEAINRKNVNTFASEVQDSVARTEISCNQLKNFNFLIIGVLCLNLIFILAMLLK